MCLGSTCSNWYLCGNRGPCLELETVVVKPRILHKDLTMPNHCTLTYELQLLEGFRAYFYYEETG